MRVALWRERETKSQFVGDYKQTAPYNQRRLELWSAGYSVLPAVLSLTSAIRCIVHIQKSAKRIHWKMHASVAPALIAPAATEELYKRYAYKVKAPSYQSMPSSLLCSARNSGGTSLSLSRLEDEVLMDPTWERSSSCSSRCDTSRSGGTSLSLSP